MVGRRFVLSTLMLRQEEIAKSLSALKKLIVLIFPIKAGNVKA